MSKCFAFFLQKRALENSGSKFKQAAEENHAPCASASKRVTITEIYDFDRHVLLFVVRDL